MGADAAAFTCRSRGIEASGASGPEPDAATHANRCMNGEEVPGISVFLRVGDDVFHTCSTCGRGIEEFHDGHPWLDLTPLGRQEPWEEPEGRAVPLGRQVGGPGLRYPDEHDD